MYSSLTDAPVNTELLLLKVTTPALEAWLQHIGIFAGSRLVRHDNEFNYSPVRIRGGAGDIVIPASLAMKILVHLDSDPDKMIPLTEMGKKESGHIEILDSDPVVKAFLGRIGIMEDSEIVFLRSLPHMDYIAIVDNRERTRLSEGEAARIWGSSGEGPVTQFYFATQNTEFEVKELMGCHRMAEHLETHGIRTGGRIILETIEQAQYLHQPCKEPVIISTRGGLRLFLTQEKAGRMVVRTA